MINKTAATPARLVRERANEERKQTILSQHSLSPAKIRAIERALEEVGEFGEVRLIVERGHLRFIGKFKTEALSPD